MSDLRRQLQEVMTNRSAADAEAASANVNFNDWQFSGQGGSVLVSVTITSASSSAITSAVVVLQTSGGMLICYGSLNTSNAGAGWTVKLSTGNHVYDVREYGTSVQAWAYAQVIGGFPQGQYSAVQNYTVQN